MSVIFRVVTRLTPAGLIPFYKSTNALDAPSVDLTKQPTTGWERLQNMYTMRNSNGVSVEMNMVLQSIVTGAFMGGCIGGMIRSRNAYLYFMETNQATIFQSTMDAKKKLQDKVTLAFARGAFEWAWRMSSFMGIFCLVTSSIQVYRDKTTVWEYILGGAIAGGVYKIHMGLIPTLVGSALGASLGLIGGIVIVAILTLTGFTLKDIQQALFRIRQFREHHLNEAQERAAEEKSDDVTQMHDTFVEKRGEVKVENIQ